MFTIEALERIEKVRSLNSIVKKELENIPRWGFEQNLFRQNYYLLRMHSLSKKATFKTKEETFRKALESTRKQFPDFEPRGNIGFFKTKSPKKER